MLVALLMYGQIAKTDAGDRGATCRNALQGVLKPQRSSRRSEVCLIADSKRLRGTSVWRKAQTMESMTSLSCGGDIVSSVWKQCRVMACSRLKNCSRCSG